VDGVSAGEVVVEIGTQFLIASHSGTFIEIANQDLAQYWYGDRDCGWDGCTLSLATIISREKTDPIPGGAVFTGIPIPFNIDAGDELTVCGSAFFTGDPVPDAWDLGVALGVFNCSDYDLQGNEFPVTALGSDEFPNSDTGSPIVCFDLKVEPTIGMVRCDAHLILGFHVLNLSDTLGTAIRFTYTLNLRRGCA
jgi:hypothetical protein